MMTRILNRLNRKKMWTVAVAVALGAVAPLAAQGPSAPAAGKQTATPSAQYVPGQAKPPDVGLPMLDLTMDQAIQRALERNLNIQVQKFAPQINDYQLQSTRAFYKPTLTSAFGYNNASQQATSSLDGGALTSTVSQTYNATLSQQLKFHGSSGSVGFTNGRTSTNNTFTLINPNYSSGLAFNVTQPLLQGWRTDNTRTSLQTQEIARQIADIGVRTSIENTIAQVRNAYWDLRGAVESIEIQRQSLAQATKFREDNETKVTIGTLAPLDVLSARNTEQTRRVGLAQAIATWQTRELVLKQLIVGGADDDAFKSTLNPTDKPDFTQITPDISSAITKALAQRTDLDTARKNIQSSEISLELTKEGTRPTLNASGGYSVRGVGGTQHSTSGGVATITPGGYFDALSSILQFSVPTWNVNFNFTYPIGMVAAKANLARSKLSLEQQRVSLKLTELNVATAVTNAALTVTNSYSSLQASTLSRQLAEETATAEQSKFEVGLSTNFNVAQTLNDLNAALLTELQARLTYLKAIIEFERLQIVGG